MRCAGHCSNLGVWVVMRRASWVMEHQGRVLHHVITQAHPMRLLKQQRLGESRVFRCQVFVPIGNSPSNHQSRASTHATLRYHDTQAPNQTWSSSQSHYTIS